MSDLDYCDLGDQVTGSLPESLLATHSPLSTNAVTFVSWLRRAGITVTLPQVISWFRALAWIEIGERDQFFHTTRALLITRHSDLDLFSALFNRFWSSDLLSEPARPIRAPRAPRHDPEAGQPFTIVNYLAWKAEHLDRKIDVVDRSATYTDIELLQNKDFSALSPEELETVLRLMRGLRWQAAQRRTRRRRPGRRGALADMGRTLRKAASHGGIPLRFYRAGRKVKQRPMVLLADISGSMEKLSRLILQLFYSLQHEFGGVEAFLFGTRLTRISSALKHRNIDRAIDASARLVGDWAGGTRIGECLAQFNRQWGRRVLGRGAVVILISDGWEQGNTEVLERELAHIRRRCHRLIWLNPLAGKDAYEPRVAGMAAALPYLDDFLPIHNLQSLDALFAHLGALPSRRQGPFASFRPGTSSRPRSSRSPHSTNLKTAGPGHTAGSNQEVPG